MAYSACLAAAREAAARSMSFRKLIDLQHVRLTAFIRLERVALAAPGRQAIAEESRSARRSLWALVPKRSLPIAGRKRS